jgi:hypothetical protein
MAPAAATHSPVSLSMLIIGPDTSATKLTRPPAIRGADGSVRKTTEGPAPGAAAPSSAISDNEPGAPAQIPSTWLPHCADFIIAASFRRY